MQLKWKLMFLTCSVFNCAQALAYSSSRNDDDSGWGSMPTIVINDTAPVPVTYQAPPKRKPAPPRRPAPKPQSVYLSKEPITEPPRDRSWSITASLGYTSYGNTYGGNGQTSMGRFAIAKDLFKLQDSSLGLELGVQSGKRFPITVSETDIANMGGLPVWTTVQPLLDVLATYKIRTFSASPIFGLLKGGLVYRRWEMDRDTVNNVYQVGGEIQAGFGYALSDTYALSLVYQGIFGGNPNFTLNPNDYTAHVDTIPAQNGIMFNFAISF